jgi:hypothetical protein
MVHIPAHKSSRIQGYWRIIQDLRVFGLLSIGKVVNTISISPDVLICSAVKICRLFPMKWQLQFWSLITALYSDSWSTGSVFHWFLTSTLNGCEWSASHYGCWGSPNIHWIEGCLAWILIRCMEEKNVVPFHACNYNFSTVQFVA